MRTTGNKSMGRRVVNQIKSVGSGLKLLVTVVGSVAGIVGASIEYAAYHHGNLAASAMNNAPFNEEGPTYFFFKVPKNTENARYLLPVRVALTNTSSGHDDEVRMVLKYDRKYLRTLVTNEAMLNDESRPAGEQHREVSSDDKYDYVKFSATFLSPKANIKSVDGAFATKTPWDTGDPILFNAGVGLDVQVHTYSKGDIDRNWNIRYRGLSVETDAEVREVMEKWYAPQVALEIRHEAGFWGYFLKWIFQKEVVMYSYSPEFRVVPGKNIFVPWAPPKQVTKLNLSPSLSVLFDFS